MMVSTKLRAWAPFAVIVFLALVPFLPFLGENRYLLSLLIGTFVFAVFAMSFDVLLGYTGIVSFGHALFFGTGTYTAVLMVKYLGAGFWTVLAAAPLLAALLALLIGSLSLRVHGVYFAMVSMAFAEFFRVLAEKFSRITGGSDGLSVQVAPDWAYGPRHRLELYFLTLGLAVLVYLLLRRILSSPFGRVLVAIRENEQRAAAIGYNVFAFKLGAIVLSGVVAALAGVMYAATENFVVPSVMGTETTIQVLLMAIIRGVGTLGGPALGAGIVRLAGTLLSSYTERWRLLLGLLYALIVLFLPGGLAGIARRWRRAASAQAGG
jgi:branched-chain amino acid transport system permease protein